MGSCVGFPAYSVNDPGSSPTILDPGLDGPTGVATDGTRIVYTISGQAQNGAIKLRDASGVRDLSRNFELNPTRIALSGAFAYYVQTTAPDPTNSNVRRVSVNGTSSSSAPVAGLRVQPSSIVVQSNIVYFTDKNGVYACDMNNTTSCGTSPDAVADRSFPCRGIVATTTRLAWLENGGVYACNRASCAGTVISLASGQHNAREMAVDGSTLFWTEDGADDQTGNVWSTSIEAAGTVTPVLCGLNHPQDIAVDGANIYVTNRGTSPDFTDGTVVRCARAGCGNKPTVMAKNQVQPYGIALDATKLYWVTRGVDSARTGTLASVAK